MNKYVNTYKGPESKNKSTKKIKIQAIIDFFKERKTQLIVGFILKAIAAFLFISFISYFFNYKFDQSVIEGISLKRYKIAELEVKNIFGVLGAQVANYFIFKKFGLSAFYICILLYSIGHKLVFKSNKIKLFKIANFVIFNILWLNIAIVYTLLILLKISIVKPIISVAAYDATMFLYGLMGHGIIILLTASLIIFIISTFDITSINFNNFLYKNKLASLKSAYLFKRGKKIDNQPITNHNEQPNIVEEKIDNQIELQIIRPDLENIEAKPSLSTKAIESYDEASSELEIKVNPAQIKPGKTDKEDKKYDPTAALPNYHYPTINLLSNHPSHNVQSVTQEELEKNKNKIIETLTNFKIGISSIKATIGPTVTLYEIIPDAGIKISKIKNLEDDIALSLSALGIRIIAPIPGKGTIGIEVPNKHKKVVAFRSIVSSEKFINADIDLPIIIGRSISNEDFIYDLASMPHLLIAGATGQGKSVGLNVVLSSLLYKKHPSQLKLVLIDPKKVELSLYNKLERHFLAKLTSAEEPIITETKHVIHTLNSLCIEMDTRYELLKEAGARNIKEYNKKFISRMLDQEQGHRFMPYIVLVIDEFADMIITAGKEVELPIARLAQLARAIGIHLVLATQRPSVNVITGTIKANFPARISFKVASKIDSRTILDVGGADQLVGRGDMLFSIDSNIIRLQCPLIDTQEVENLCEYIGEQKGYNDAYLLPTYEEEGEYNNTTANNPLERDSLFEEAAQIIVSQQQGSTSLIQRKLKIGYNRAGRIIDQMEQAGIVGPFEGSKAREVLIKSQTSLYEMLEKLNSNNYEKK
jgi:S-DNA-T family DNA segregation ATPase FtsK/SpoIIIE